MAGGRGAEALTVGPGHVRQYDGPYGIATAVLRRIQLDVRRGEQCTGIGVGGGGRDADADRDRQLLGEVAKVDPGNRMAEPLRGRAALGEIRAGQDDGELLATYPGRK